MSLRLQKQVAFRAGDDAALELQDELAADETLEARAPSQRGQLLVESSGEEGELRHRLRKTPVTRPRIWTCFA